MDETCATLHAVGHKIKRMFAGARRFADVEGNDSCVCNLNVAVQDGQQQWRGRVPARSACRGRRGRRPSRAGRAVAAGADVAAVAAVHAVPTVVAVAAVPAVAAVAGVGGWRRRGLERALPGQECRDAGSPGASGIAGSAAAMKRDSVRGQVLYREFQLFVGHTVAPGDRRPCKHLRSFETSSNSGALMEARYKT